MSHVLPPELQLPGILVLLAFLGWVLAMVRARRLSLRDSLLWLLSTVGALAVTAYPQLLVRLSALFGVQVPSNALFGIAILYLSVNVLSITIASSSNAALARRLAQECALLRAELDSLKRDQGG